MALDPGLPIIITGGFWRHIRYVRIYHRYCPEVRGEGRSLADAAAHLANQLVRALDFDPDHGGHGVLERALADVRALQSADSEHRPRPMAAIS
ncbi:MAG: hypothetical protein IRY99_13780 [Isosphaeraceae bacterium]|nr:hypothetical protein [Isosphaeraceae bacterium]